MTKVFDTSTLQGLRAAERFKTRLNNTCQSVNVYAIGLNRVQIVGLGTLQHSPANLDQSQDSVSPAQFETVDQMSRKGN